MSMVSAARAPRKRLYRKAEDAAQRILDAFKAGDLPKPLAAIFIRRKDDSPCRQWSWSNQLIVALCGFTDARGFRQWEQVGRKVKKGEKAFPILCPCTRKRTEKNAETGQEEDRTYLYGFTSAPVFGFEQTAGADLPTGDEQVDEWFRSLPLREVAESWGLTLGTFNGEKANYLGYYKHSQGIALGVENLATWAHELVHAADDRNGTITRQPGQQPDNEIVAELGGAVLLEILGYATESDRGGCWRYVETYAEKEERDTLAVCMSLLKRVCDCVALVLDSAEELSGEGVAEAPAACQ